MAGPGSRRFVSLLLISCPAGKHTADHNQAFAAPGTANRPCAPGNGDPHSNTSPPILTWGNASYAEGDMLAYDNLTTSITPLISIMFVNHTNATDISSAYAESHLTCLHPSNLASNSRKPSGVPSAGTSLSGPTTLWLSVAMVLAWALR